MSLIRIHRSSPRSLRLPLALVALLVLASPAWGQVSVGADVVSRYVWRGVDFGESMAVQPAITFGAGGLEFGAWGSYSISSSGASANENDLWATYTVAASSGLSVAFGLTDYYFPAPDADAGFGTGNAHTLEVSLAFSGPETFPVTLFGGMLTGGSDLYVEAGVPFTVAAVDVGLHMGFVGGESDFYGTSGAALVNLGVTASKGLRITETFELPVSVAYILNPDQDRAHLVFAISIAP
ncbi:TorF family putative porin [Candidatus Palauibacter sp.]|uniref:TorF family putative porin n=1 Tax=Candidatus Palauibacter sp. TaxID=3101350 RepID=UPI003AF303C1